MGHPLAFGSASHLQVFGHSVKGSDFDTDLQWCRRNHASADSDEKSVAALIQKEVDAGFMELVGDEAAVRKRFPSGQLAVGKLGVVQYRKRGSLDW